MERMLLKMAAQLNAFDEASLMALWERLAEQVENFEPTKRWEEYAIAFGMIQALHMKNQLFNHNLANASRISAEDISDGALLASWGRKKKSKDKVASKSSEEVTEAEPQTADSASSSRRKVLTFKPRD